MLAQNGVRCIDSCNVYRVQSAHVSNAGYPGNVFKCVDCGYSISLCMMKRMVCVFVADGNGKRGWERGRMGWCRKDAETDDQRGGLSVNYFLFRPDDNFRLAPPSPPISRNGVQNCGQRLQINWQVSSNFTPPRSSVSCNLPNSWQGPTPGFPRRCLKIPIVCPRCITYDSSAYAYFPRADGECLLNHRLRRLPKSLTSFRLPPTWSPRPVPLFLVPV